jgi:predicted DCC family thiol-disulfide oxidoreductase YuxK
MAQSDNCIFYKENCVVCVYVDDFLVTGASNQEIHLVKERLNQISTK